VELSVFKNNNNKNATKNQEHSLCLFHNEVLGDSGLILSKKKPKLHTPEIPAEILHFSTSERAVFQMGLSSILLSDRHVIVMVW